MLHKQKIGKLQNKNGLDTPLLSNDASTSIDGGGSLPLKTFVLTAYVRKDAECMRRYAKLRSAAKGKTEKAGAVRGPCGELPPGRAPAVGARLPSVGRTRWTEEEDRKIVELVQRLGPKRWARIAWGLPGELENCLHCTSSQRHCGSKTSDKYQHL